MIEAGRPPTADEVDDVLDAQLHAAVHAVRVFAHAIQVFRHNFARNFDLTVTDTVALSHLALAGPMSAGELAQRTGLAASSVTTLLDRLERVGLARRTTPAANRRTVHVTLTDAARAALRESESLTHQALLELGANNLPEFTRLLQKFADELQRVTATAGSIGRRDAMQRQV